MPRADVEAVEHLSIMSKRICAYPQSFAATEPNRPRSMNNRYETGALPPTDSRSAV
jgi:hypothetical protein